MRCETGVGGEEVMKQLVTGVFSGHYYCDNHCGRCRR